MVVDNYYCNKEVFKLMSDCDEYVKQIEELKQKIKNQDELIDYYKYLLSSVISMN